jgi:hypothetical protein
MRYRLTPPWSNADLEQFELRDPDLVWRLKQLENRESGRNEWEPVHCHLEYWLKRVDIDADAALKWICRPSSPRQQSASRTVQLIKLGEPRMSVDRFGRVHSVIARTQSRLRKYLHVDGETLVEQDISSCQPLLLGLFCMQSGLGRDMLGREKQGFLPNRSTYAPTWVNGQLPSDLKDWITFCENGVFYEQFAETIGMLCRSHSQRDLVKTDWCKFTYGPTKDWSRKWIAYCERWPTITSVLNALKADDYRNASHVLQKFESDIMIRGVAEEMRRAHPDAPICTVHDSVLTTKSMAENLRDIIKRHWSACGANPNIKSA